MLLDRDSSTSKCLALADAEVAEIIAKEGSKITRAPIKDLHLSHYMTIAGLIRDGKGQLVGATRSSIPATAWWCSLSTVYSTRSKNCSRKYIIF